MPLAPDRRRSRRLLALTVASLTCGALVLTGSPSLAAKGGPKQPPPGQTVPVRLIGFNDLHGNLDPPAGSSGQVTLADGSVVAAGGAAYLAAHAKRLGKQSRNSFVVSSGDAVGASPVNSAIFRDEPSIEVLNAMGTKAMAVGNHEFDEGYGELLRLQNGGCHPVDGCQFRKRFTGADFPILGANVYREPSGRPALLPYTVLKASGVKVGVIGVTLQGVPDIVARAGIEGLRFGSEAKAINRTSRALERQGIRAQMVLMHQGDQATPGGGPNACNVTAGGPAAAVVASTRSQVDGFMLGHSHQAYNCSVADPSGAPRPVIQGASFGRLLSVIDLKVDRRTRDVVRSRTTATNQVVTRDIAPDPRVQSIIDRANELSAPLANQPVGSVAEDIARGATRNEETPLGNLIADAQLAATQESNGAQIALMNPGGVRADLVFASSPAGEGDGVVTYGEAYAVQPFGNILQTLTYTGAQLRAVLEQQGDVGLQLQSSAGFTYTFAPSAPSGSRVSDMELDGVPIQDGDTYRVTVNNFLADGGDGFTALREGTDVAGAQIDLDAFVDYLGANPDLAAPATDRVARQ